jgi:hypothetical protein
MFLAPLLAAVGDVAVDAPLAVINAVAVIFGALRAVGLTVPAPALSAGCAEVAPHRRADLALVVIPFLVHRHSITDPRVLVKGLTRIFFQNANRPPGAWPWRAVGYGL